MRLVILIATVVVASLSLAGSAQAQSQLQTCEPWVNVKSFQGTINVTGSGTTTDSGFTTSFHESDIIQVQLVTLPGQVCAGGWGWQGSSKATVSADLTFSFPPELSCSGEATVSNKLMPFDPSLVTAGVVMDFERGTYGIGGEGLTTNSVPFDSSINTPGCLGPPVTNFGGYGPSCTPDLTGLPIVGGVTPADLSSLVGNTHLNCASEMVGGGSFDWNVSWNLVPTQATWDLLVTIPQYATWRPAGGKTEKDTGQDPATGSGLLEIRAQLVDKDTGLPSFLVPDKVTFLLADVSQEPGVAMNWPPQGTATTDPDLSFDCANNFQAKVGGSDCLTSVVNQTNAGGVQADFAPSDVSPVVAILTPHDWGAWATLNVTAMLGGTPIKGHLQSTDASATNILLPQRQPGSFVADSWKTAKGIALETTDDSDGEVELNSWAGDGLTLYEEYRGFYMGCFNNDTAQLQAEGSRGALCQRVEGDPKRKDLFIAALTPADAGILQFAADTNIKVHFSGLSLEELGGHENNGAYERVINFNHAQGAHVVDQHALVIELGPLTSLSAVIDTRSVAAACPHPFVTGVIPNCRPGLPREIDSVSMGAYFETQDLDATNPEWVYTLTHELGHAVDAYHHGDFDHQEFWTTTSGGGIAMQPLDGNGNAAGAATPIHVLPETADPSSPFVEVSMSELNPNQTSNNNPKDPQGNRIPGQFVFVGNVVCGNTVIMHGQHSGDVNSAMRYAVAQAYIPTGFPDVRFWVHEDRGYEITDHPEGTGVNLSGRTPRVRYGDAYGDGTEEGQRGNDGDSVDINDNHNAVVKPGQTCTP
jgi:hypothetical protein